VKRKGGDDRPRLSRREQYENAHQPYDDPPEPDYYWHLVEWWSRAGAVASGAMGPVPLSRLELKQFSDDECLSMTGWERTKIIEMSRRYCWAQNHFKKAGIAPPFMSEETRDALEEYRNGQRRLTQKLIDMGIKL